jgi:glycine reductase
MKEQWRVVHYINQFFAGIGGEEKARVGLSEKAGPIGLRNILQEVLMGKGEVVATLFCGDDYFIENQDEVLDQAIKIIASHKPDLLIAGPAFNAGRYGQACGTLCSSVQRELGIPAVTGMYTENPAVELFRRDIYIIKTTDRAMKIPELLNKMIRLGIKLAKGEMIGPPAEEGYIPRGMKRNIFVEKTAAERAINMLLDKLKGCSFSTEIQPPKYDAVNPPRPVKDMSKAVIALVTDGGIVPVGNPDRIKGASGKTFGKYSVKDLDDLTQGNFECIHAGIDNRIASADPDRFVPVDVMRDLEREGKIGQLYEWVYSTSGCTMEFDSAIHIGQEIAKDLLKNGVTGVILTSA